MDMLPLVYSSKPAKRLVSLGPGTLTSEEQARSGPGPTAGVPSYDARAHRMAMWCRALRQ